MKNEAHMCSPILPKVPAMPSITTRITNPAMTVRPRDWKIAPIDASCSSFMRREKSLSRLPQHPPGGVAFQAPAVRRHRKAEREIHDAREQVGLDAEAGPRRILQGNLDGAEEIEQPDDQHQRGVLEKADEGVHQRRNR